MIQSIIESSQNGYRILSSGIGSIGTNWWNSSYSFVTTLSRAKGRCGKTLASRKQNTPFITSSMKLSAKRKGTRRLPESVHQEIIDLTKKLVEMMDKASNTVDFFKKNDEIKAMKRKIKHGLLDTSFGDDARLRKTVIDGFAELAKVKFGGK